MREITLGDQTVTIVATPLTLYIYSREFGPKADLMADLMSFHAVEEGRPEDVRFLAILKILWAMCKTAKLGLEFPSFADWITRVDVDMSDATLWEAVLGEAARGLFRGAKVAVPAGAKQPAV